MAHDKTPESWTKIAEGFELTAITRRDGTHPRPLAISRDITSLYV